jgi:acylphosphatase
MASPIQCQRLLISGRVQGVGFRFSVRNEARRLGLTGLGRNLLDGRVEFIAEGAPAALADLENWCRRGPPLANVTEVTIEILSNPHGFRDFDIAS